MLLFIYGLQDKTGTKKGLLLSERISSSPVFIQFVFLGA